MIVHRYEIASEVEDGQYVGKRFLIEKRGLQKYTTKRLIQA